MGGRAGAKPGSRPFELPPDRRSTKVSEARSQVPQARVPDESRVTQGNRWGNFLLLVLVFLIYSRFPDHVALYLGSSGHIIRVLSALTLAATILGGGLKRALLTRPNLYLALFTLWNLLAVPFSIWKGGSFKVVVDSWLKQYLLYLAIAGLIVTARQCRRVLYTLGAATLAIAVMSLVVPKEATERLQLEGGALGNPNDLAFFLLIGLPFCLLPAAEGKGRPVLRVAALLSSALIVLLVLKTGSRGGMVVMIGLVLMMFWMAPRSVKAGIALASVLLVPLGLALAPKGILERYRTLFASEPAEESLQVGRQTEMAEASAAQRKNLFQAGVQLTLRHPLLGVGPGMFGVALAGDEHARDVLRIGWRDPHNTYTQISSGAGLPALAFYVGAIACCLRKLFRLRRQARARTQASQWAPASVLLALASFCLGGMFWSYAYQAFVPILAGLTTALERAARMETAAVAARRG